LLAIVAAAVAWLFLLDNAFDTSAASSAPALIGACQLAIFLPHRRFAGTLPLFLFNRLLE
jgi:hypothetical protein